MGGIVVIDGSVVHSGVVILILCVGVGNFGVVVVDRFSLFFSPEYFTASTTVETAKTIVLMPSIITSQTG